jgi:hypothetical protein
VVEADADRYDGEGQQEEAHEDQEYRTGVVLCCLTSCAGSIALERVVKWDQRCTRSSEASTEDEPNRCVEGRAPDQLHDATNDLEETIKIEECTDGRNLVTRFAPAPRHPSNMIAAGVFARRNPPRSTPAGSARVKERCNGASAAVAFALSVQ